jgi:hypothetical protein
MALHGLAEHMCIMSTKAGNFLLKPRASASHQLFIALVPQFIAMQERAWNAAARGFDEVLVGGIGPERRQFAMPVDD